MENILAINSSEKQAEIALFVNNKKVIHKLSEGESHSEFLLQEIEDLLIKENVKLNEINNICVNVGPGSFTGIRIGLSFLKAFLMSLNLNAVSVSNFEIISYNILNKPKEYYVVISNNIKEVYYCKCENNKLSYGYFSIEELNELLNKNISVFCNEQDYNVLNNKKLNCVKIGEDSFINLCISKVKNKEFKNINEISPLYIKKSQAEIELQNKILNNLQITENVNLSELVNLEMACFKEDYYSENLLKEDLNNNLRKQYFAYYNNELIGYINFEVVLDEINLIKICVKEEFRGNLVASRLMEKMVDFKNKNNINKIFLEVSEKNKGAIKLYEKVGFKNSGYIDENLSDCVNYIYHL